MPRPGQYREVLVPGLERIGEEELAKAMANKDMMLAFANSITGPVQVKRNLTPVFIEAMESVKGELGADKDDIIKYYSDNLDSGSTVPVVNNCAEINARIGDRIYASGELFFTT